MIDAAIPLQQKAPDFLGQMSQLQNIGLQQGNMQAQQQNSQLRNIGMQSDQLKLNAERQGSQDDADVRAAMAAGTQIDPQTGQPKLDRGAMLNTLGRLNPTKAVQMQTSLASQDVASTEAQQKVMQAKLATATATNSAMDKVLQGVNDQPSYTNALQHAQALGVDVSQFPPQYDPQIVARAHQQVLSTQDMLKQKNEEITQGQAAQSEKDRSTQAAATLANTNAYQKAQLSQGQQRIGISAGELSLKRQQAGIGVSGSPSDLATAIAQGHIAPDRMGYLLAKNPALIQSVMQIDPSFDSSKAASYAQAYKDFTSSKTNSAGGALNAGATAMIHLQNLQQLNTLESRIPGTQAHQAYQNQLDTLAPELAKFYGDSTIPGIQSYKDTLGATFNRDAAIKTQAHSMGVKFDNFQQTWDNAAPSKSYEAPMPGVSTATMAARAALDHNYKAPQASQSGGMVTMKAPNGQTKQVSADQVDHYKAQGATVIP